MTTGYCFYNTSQGFDLRTVAADEDTSKRLAIHFISEGRAIMHPQATSDQVNEAYFRISEGKGAVYPITIHRAPLN